MTLQISDRRQRALTETDNMSPALRECVHEFGYAIVMACLQAKVKEPTRIRQLVREIWEGARQPAQRRKRLGTLDWILLQAGAQISAATLRQVLEGSGYGLVPTTPNGEMVEASMRAVTWADPRITKYEKHRRRLTAAIEAARIAR